MAVVLIVEDEIFIREDAKFIVEDLGHNVLLASNLTEAIVHLSAPPPIDALFVDIRLSAFAFSGYEVAIQAISLKPGLRVLYTSGTPLSVDMSDRFVRQGQFLQKPYTAQQLEASVGRLFH